MDIFLTIILALITLICGIIPIWGAVIDNSGKGLKSMTRSGWIISIAGFLGFIITIISAVKDQHDKDIEESKTTNSGKIDPSTVKDSVIVWYLGSAPFYFPSGRIDLRDVAIKHSAVILAPFEGVDFKARIVDHKLKVSTTIRDSSGNIITQMVDNEWIVNRPQFAFDRNFNDTSLEVKDNLGNIVFQIDVSGNKMVMNCMFVKPDGSLAIVFLIKKATPEMPGFNGIANFESGNYRTTSQYCHYKPMFRYPSSIHPKERLPMEVDNYTGIRFDNIPPYPKIIRDSAKNFLIIGNYWF
jgi:hypothetical protein